MNSPIGGKKAPRPPRRASVPWPVTAGVGVLVAALILAGGFAFAPHPLPTSLQKQPERVDVPVLSEEFSDERLVSLALTLSAARALVAPASGVITSIACTAGAPLASGTVPIEINAQPVVAVHTTVPLWRDLSRGIKGTDVTALQTELQRLGFATPVDGTFGRSTETAVAALFAAAGFKHKGALQLAETIWLPSEAPSILRCPVLVGDTIGAGTVVIELPPDVLAAAVSPLPQNLVAGERLVVVDGLEPLPINLDGTITDPTALGALVQSSTVQYYINSVEKVAPSVTIRLAAPVSTTAVPPASIAFGAADFACVTHDAKAYPVTVVQSRLGQAFVQFLDDIPPAVDSIADGEVPCG